MQTNYLDWAIRQKEFSDKLKGSRSVVLSHWGDYSYNVSIPGYDGEGRKHIFRFQVEQLFCESFCQAEGLNYDVYPRAKENARKV